MTYIKVHWRHEFDDEPCWIISEFDERRHEIRKVEIYPNGTKGYADRSEEAGGTCRTHMPYPSNEEIADEEFEVSAIDRQEFDEIWNSRKANVRH